MFQAGEAGDAVTDGCRGEPGGAAGRIGGGDILAVVRTGQRLEIQREDPLAVLVEDAVNRADALLDRKSVVEGKSVSVRVDLGGPRSSKTKITHNHII